MRRPTRTRRPSTAAIFSMVMFAAVAGAGAKSVWIPDQWSFISWQGIRLIGGRVIFWHWHGKSMSGEDPAAGHRSFKAPSAITEDFWKFGVFDTKWAPELGDFRLLEVCVPLWFPLLLLLIAPVRWLIARPPNAPAFPVINDAKQEHA